MNSQYAALLRLAARVTVLACSLCAIVAVGAQFEGIVAKNISIAGELAASRANVAALRQRERDDERTIRRLADPQGAIPEIHEKLHLIGPREQLFYVRDGRP